MTWIIPYRFAKIAGGSGLPLKSRVWNHFQALKQIIWTDKIAAYDQIERFKDRPVPGATRPGLNPAEANNSNPSQPTHIKMSTGAMSKSKKQKSKSGKPTLAERADKFICYQKSVQTPEHEVEFFEKAYRDANGRVKPQSLREDFCGTFAVCCKWVGSNRQRTAVGVDLCGDTLQWGRDHNLVKLSESEKARVKLLHQDVRKRNRPQVDVLAAQNFSFWIFKTRKELVDYFRVARANLKPGGIMVMDMMGGGECYTEELVDKRKITKGKKGFTYMWEQATFNPVTADASFYISFKFADGSKLKRAFEYHWRFWTIPEVRELLKEAGFSESHVYWENEDEDDENYGEWERGEDAPSNPSWISYIVALK